MDINISSGSSITINGTTYSGKNIQITNGKVIIDGAAQEQQLEHIVNVTVNGNVDSLENGAGNITANDVVTIKTGSGDINCRDVYGSIRTGSGDVTCNDAKGNISTGSGDIIHRKR